MKKIFLLIAIFISSVFAEVDGHLDIVKKGMVLPKVGVSIASDSLEKETLSKIKKALIDDFNVSGHFEVANVSSVSAYDSLPDILGLSNQGVNLFVNLSAKKDGNGNYTLMTKLYQKMTI